MTAIPMPKPMNVGEFMAWDDGRFELVEGVPRLMAPHNDAHATIQSNIIGLVRTHLAARGGPCRPATEGGVQPRVRSQFNCRKPDLMVTCTPHRPGNLMVPDPVLIVEILSTNEDETRDNIARFISIESVREIVLFHADRPLAEVWRRGPDGWPADPEFATDTVRLDSIDLDIAFGEAYRWVNFAE